jgi:hypothetical protein
MELTGILIEVMGERNLKFRRINYLPTAARINCENEIVDFVLLANFAARSVLHPET